MPRRPLITITTDFGLKDPFVGVVKGVILGINPEVSIVDLNLQVSSYDVFDGALSLAQSYRSFPVETIHLVIVDPGVGGSRRPIVARTMDYKFVAPDNGVLSLVYEREENVEVREIDAEHYFLNPVSKTFHGRDVFGPIAAWLTRGVEVTRLGEQITDFVRFAAPKPKPAGEGVLKGVALKVDKFGTLITNLTPENAPQLFSENPSPFKLIINQKEITQLRQSYSEGKPSEVFAILGSSGYLEVATNRGSAAKLLKVGRGVEVTLELGRPPS